MMNSITINSNFYSPIDFLELHYTIYNSKSMVLCLVNLFLQCLSGKCMVFVNGNCQSFRTTKMYVIKEEGVSYFLYFIREVWLHWGDWLRVESRVIICCMLYINYEIFEQKHIFHIFKITITNLLQIFNVLGK